MWPGDEGLATLFLWETFEGLRFVCQEVVEGAVCFGGGEERADVVVDEVGGVDGDEVLVS